MSFLKKLFAARNVPASAEQVTAPKAAPKEQLVQPEVILPLAGLDEPREIVELLRLGELDSAFNRLNSLKASHPRTPNVDYLRAHLFLQKQQPVAAVEALKEELRWFPNNELAKQALKSLNPPPAALQVGDPDFQAMAEVIRPYTMVGEERLYSLYRLAREACEKDLPGNFVECGVAAGGTSALLAGVIKKYSRRPRKIYSFDTFEGMPAATKEDAHQGTPADATGWGQGTCAAPIDSLVEAATKVGAQELVQPVKGLFAETLPPTKAQIGQIAFLHVDGDWYSSTMDVMSNLYDQVVPGAPIQVDDYGFWEGCKKAMEDFQRDRGLNFQLHKIDFTGVWFYRP